MNIYIWEIIVVTIILSTTTVIMTGGLTIAEWVGTVSVILTFAHAAAANALRENPFSHHSKKYLNVYLITKELSWLFYMILISAYAGIAGTILFLLYPLWRWGYNYAMRKKNRDG